VRDVRRLDRRARATKSSGGGRNGDLGILVCEQVIGGVEMVVGVSHDELFNRS
jgi:hypothetical protein